MNRYFLYLNKVYFCALLSGHNITIARDEHFMSARCSHFAHAYKTKYLTTLTFININSSFKIMI